MAFPELRLGLIYPYICLNTKDKNPEKLLAACNRFLGLLQLSMKLALQKARVADSELLNFNLIARAIGRKVVILFDGTWSTITEDPLRSLHTILGMFAAANLNLTTSLKSFVDLFDLISAPSGNFSQLFTDNVPEKADFGSKKIIDFLLKGFTLQSKLTGNFSEKSAQKVFDIISKVFMPGYVKTVIDQILKFQDAASKLSIG